MRSRSWLRPSAVESMKSGQASRLTPPQALPSERETAISVTSHIEMAIATPTFGRLATGVADPKTIVISAVAHPHSR